MELEIRQNISDSERERVENILDQFLIGQDCGEVGEVVRITIPNGPHTSAFILLIKIHFTVLLRSVDKLFCIQSIPAMIRKH